MELDVRISKSCVLQHQLLNTGLDADGNFIQSWASYSNKLSNCLIWNWDHSWMLTNLSQTRLVAIFSTKSTPSITKRFICPVCSHVLNHDSRRTPISFGCCSSYLACYIVLFVAIHFKTCQRFCHINNHIYVESCNVHLTHFMEIFSPLQIKVLKCLR